MEGLRLILNDGTVLENASAGYFDGSIILYIHGMTLQEAFAIVFDPLKTSRIIFQYGEMQDIYIGYTTCVNIGINNDGEVTAILNKGGD